LKRKRDGIDVAGRQPGFYLYPEDLERELRVLPLESQAIWIRMLLHMHWAPRRGYLEHASGAPFTSGDIARLLGIREKKLEIFLKEMHEKFGIFSRDENGVIFNRRMVRDTEISLKRKEAGSKGGNPTLLGLDNQNPDPPPDLDKQNGNLLNHTVNQNSSKSATPRACAIPSPIPSPSKDLFTHTQSAAALPAGVRVIAPRAADMTAAPSTRFEEFWERWPRRTNRDAAASAWCSYVTKENEQKVFACLERFLRSGDVARGAIPNAGPAPGKAGWLADCFRDQWECNWPAAPANGNGQKAGASVLRHEDRKPPSTEELIRAHESQAENDRDPAAREFSRKWLQEHARRG